MFKVGRWKNEKIKVVFRLQFQATQVPCLKSRLMISLVPVDVGQPTVRLGKAVVQDGICTWENPVYEAVKFIRETKTGKLQDKFYHFIISTGSSKSGFLGEVSVNLADYVEATTPFTMSLPIKSNSGAILHVTIQNMEGEDDQRDLQRQKEEHGELDYELQDQLSNSQLGGDENYNTLENEYYTETASPNDKGRRNLRNGNTLHSILGQKDSRVPEETCSLHNVDEKACQTKKRSTLDWSSEDEIAEWLESTEKKTPREQKQEHEPPKGHVEQLEKEIFALKREAEVTDIELQSLRRQVVKETKRGQDLSRQVVRLREERDAFREKFEELRSLQKNDNADIDLQKELGNESKKSRDHLTEVEEDLIHAKDLNRSLRSQLRKAQDSNSELILLVRDFEEKLDKKDRELANLSSKMTSDSKDAEHKLTYNSKEVDLTQQQIQELQSELEDQVKEKRNLEKQVEQFSQDYETSKKENRDLSSKFNQKQMELIKKEKECAQNLRKVEELESQIARNERVIQKQAEEFSESLCTINELETEVKSLTYKLEKQAVDFSEDLNEMANARVEQEQRALQAEENLRKLKLEKANATQKLQEEFQKLSEELASKFKENEELSMRAEAETMELRSRITILDEHLLKANKELELVQDQCETEVQKLSTLLREKETELERLILGYKNETEELRSNKKKVEDKSEAISHENQALRMEVERLTEENYYFTEQLEEMKVRADETNTALEEAGRERDELDRKYASLRMEIEKSKEELKALGSLKEKNEAMSGVQSKLESVQAQHNELKNQLAELKTENENLKKQITRLKESLQKKDNEIALLEKLKNSNSKEVTALKEKVKQLKAVRSFGVSPENGNKAEERKHMGRKLQNLESSGKSLHNGANRTSGESRRETFLEKKLPDSRTSDLLTEVASMKEKNKSMEDELKEMQEKYSEVSLKFAEVESERQQLVMTVRNLRNGQKK